MSKAPASKTETKKITHAEANDMIVADFKQIQLHAPMSLDRKTETTINNTKIPTIKSMGLTANGDIVVIGLDCVWMPGTSAKFALFDLSK